MLSPARATDLGLLTLRLGVGAVFFAHGWMKLMVMGHEGVTGFFDSVGIPMPSLAAWGVTILETAGAAALAAGAFTRVLGALFAVNMAGAIAFVVFPKGFVGGWELEFTLGIASLALALVGGGAWSVDARFAARTAT